MSKAHVLERLRDHTSIGKIIVGIDPDLHTTGLCWWKVGEPVPWKVAVLRVPKAIKGQDVACWMRENVCLGDMRGSLGLIEGQRHRRAKGHETKNPQSITDLATVAGLLAGALALIRVAIVEPAVWKGSIPKAQHQARVLLKIPGTRFKSTQTYSYPVAGPLIQLGKEAGLKRTDWKHVTDAVGIAQWGIKKIEEIKKRERLLGRRHGN